MLELIKDKDENIRRAAIEILNTCRDKRAVDKLIEATRDKDWWVSERAADALAEIGDAKALPALLEMMAQQQSLAARRPRGRRQARHHKILDKMLPYLQRPEKEVRVAAIGAVAQLAGEQQAEAVRPYIQQSAQGADETVARAVSKALQKLDGRLSPSGRFTASTSLAGTAASAAAPRRADGRVARAGGCRATAPTAATRAPAQPPASATSTATARCSSTDPTSGRGARRRPKRPRSI